MEVDFLGRLDIDLDRAVHGHVVAQSSARTEDCS